MTKHYRQGDEIPIGRFRIPIGKFVAGLFAAVLLIVGLTFLAIYTFNTKSVTGGCRKVASFSLGGTEAKSFTLRDGTIATVAVVLARSNGGSGTLKVGEQSESITFSSGKAEERNGFRVGMIGSNTSGQRTSLNLVAADCTSSAGSK